MIGSADSQVTKMPGSPSEPSKSITAFQELEESKVSQNNNKNILSPLKLDTNVSNEADSLLKVNVPSVDTSAVSQELGETEISAGPSSLARIKADKSLPNINCQLQGSDNAILKLAETGVCANILNNEQYDIEGALSNSSLKKIQECVNKSECFKTMENSNNGNKKGVLSTFIGKVATIIKNTNSFLNSTNGDNVEPAKHSKLPLVKLEESEIAEKIVKNSISIDTDSEEESCPEDSGIPDEENYGDSTCMADTQDLEVPKSPVPETDLNRRSSLKRKLQEDVETSTPKRVKRSIEFDGVTVFYFPRSQGFNCVPSQGGSTLGMSRKHFHMKKFTISEHATEQKRLHKEYLLKLRQQRNNPDRILSQYSSSEESEEASDISDSEVEAEAFYFLQPLHIRQRRSLLRQCGIRQIEGVEKEECKDIRVSREMCGCQCKMYCDPETCQCAIAGIKCQVDRHSFPCGCSRDGCGNKNGRIEFNPIRVRTHFLHTLMRIEIEKRQQAHWNPSSSSSTLDLSSSSSLPFFTAPSTESNSCLPTASISGATFEPTTNATRLLDDRNGDYGLAGCSMFSAGLVSPLDTVSHFQQTYVPNMASLSHGSGSPFAASSFPYSAAAVAAAVAAVVPNGNPYSLQSGFCNGPGMHTMSSPLNGSEETCYDSSTDKGFSLSDMLSDDTYPVAMSCSDVALANFKTPFDAANLMFLPSTSSNVNKATNPTSLPLAPPFTDTKPPSQPMANAPPTPPSPPDEGCV